MIEINNTTKFKINKKELIAVAEKFFRMRKIKNKNISVAFISDGAIKKLNFIYRKKNKATDILSFTGEGDFFGEIVISPAQIKRQAAELKTSFKKELLFIFVHGLLHLAGYNDETEKDRLKMIELGEEFFCEK
ncbi:MAG: rRNA maturation RNase YbeY [Patescibacteria group bacterium]|jgi:probable rRNA maturation factor